MAALVGAALGVAARFMQALFGNPLAEPGVTGVSAGARVARCCHHLRRGRTLVLPAAAFAGALLTVAASTRSGVQPQPRPVPRAAGRDRAQRAARRRVITRWWPRAATSSRCAGSSSWLQGDLDARTGNMSASHWDRGRHRRSATLVFSAT
ncbi:iron chelate uptake ABC transporter family permease subunit [Nonomuraea rubra]|uniref:iron chelate uptake ABC transporter family permease subunit n=1 Tax=Nonomuraea rubra TaxID=46180 RepID=UPI0031EC7BEC